MSTIAEIEAAIEKLSDAQIEELAGWLEAARLRRATPSAVDRWLEEFAGVEGVYVTHFATCPKASMFSSGRRGDCN
jgi:hypothetical protein